MAEGVCVLAEGARGMMPDLREALLRVMDAKHHPAFPNLTRPGLGKAQLLTHFAHEYHTYVRDFPVLLARVLAHGPPDDVRNALAENIFEEQTGKLSLGVSHPKLFLRMMAGLQITEDELEEAGRDLHPAATAYRAFLDDVTAATPWVVGAAVMTIFVEGSVHERAELAGTREVLPIERAIDEHPMVKFYGCPREAMDLARAHRMVEGGHRKDAWESVLGHIERPTDGQAVVAAVERARACWFAYRDGVAERMGVASR